MIKNIVNLDVLSKIEFSKPYAWLSTWFGCGLIKKAPGTWGTLGSIPFAVAIWSTGGWQLLLLAVVIISSIGYWAADRFEKATGTHDAGSVVIDEVAGMWLTLVVSSFSITSVIIGFALFRFFDILKPWPISWCDKELSGAKGVMADDIVAGIFAAICLMVVERGIQYGIGFD